MKQIYSLIIAVAFLLLTACDTHKEFPDTAMKQCHVLCTDGKVLSYEEYQAQNKTAVAIVFDINLDGQLEGNGYAIYLWDIKPTACADS